MTPSRQFPTSYQESREIFLGDLEQIQKFWPNARIESRPLPSEEDLTLDWIAAEPSGSFQKAVILTCGIHGVEGFVGNRMRMLFQDEFLEKLDPSNTGLYLVHVINPWGMKYKRRVTKRNIDMNRNFVLESDQFQEEINPDYNLYDHILNPDRQLSQLWWEISTVIGSVIGNLIRKGVTSLRNAVLQGQRFNSEGLYYSGHEYEPETRELMALFKEIFSKYPNALLIDIHTAFYQLDILYVLSVHDQLGIIKGQSILDASAGEQDVGPCKHGQRGIEGKLIGCLGVRKLAAGYARPAPAGDIVVLRQSCGAAGQHAVFRSAHGRVADFQIHDGGAGAVDKGRAWIDQLGQGKGAQEFRVLNDQCPGQGCR